MSSHGFDPSKSSTTQPRRAWLKWLGAIAAILLIGLFSLYFGWRQRASNRLDQLLASYRAAGEPTTLADLKHPYIPDEQNAGLLYLKAAAAFQDSRKKPHLNEFVGNVSICRQHPDLLASLVDSNAQSLALLHEARSLPACNFGVQFTTPAINVTMPHLSDIRLVARLGSAAATHAHLGGDDSGAIDRILDLLSLSRAARADSQTMLQFLVAVAVDSIACRAVESTYSDDEPGTNAIARPSSEQLSILMHVLKDEDEPRASFHAAMIGERVTMMDTILAMVDNPTALGAPPPGPLNWLLRPAFIADLTGGQKFITRIAELAKSPTSPDALSQFPRKETDLAGQGFQISMTSILMPSYERSIVLFYRMLAERRLAACGLAIRLYERDNGRLPATLAELVPQYLPVIPLDPMCADSRPISYQPDPEVPILYSVGDNGRDDGGREHERGKDNGPDDHAFYLFGNRPPPPPIPNASSDDSDEEDSAGHE